MLKLESNVLWLTYKFLISQGIKRKTIENWKQQNIGHRIRIKNEVSISYNSIPITSRKKLPPEKVLIQQLTNMSKGNKVENIYNELEYSRHFNFTQYKSLYNIDTTLSENKITEFAKLHSVWVKILEMKKNEGLRDLKNLYEAFSKIYPGKYNSKIAFSNAITKALCDGVMSVSLDKRVFGNNNSQNKKDTIQINYAIAMLVASNGKFTNSEILEKANSYFKENGLKEYGLSWVKKMRSKWLKNIEVYKSRYGQNETSKKMPFASLKNPDYSNTVWQMDGKRFPFWGANFKRYDIVIIIDSTSKKIVGFAFGESENSIVIMEAIRDAVNNTGLLPFEIITDNHSFNETKECINLVNLLNKKGTKWTVTQNPQYKAIVERYNQNIDALCKEYYGYLGKGIRSKSIEDITSDELKSEYAKNFLTENEIKAIAISVIEKYNSTPLRNSKTPSQNYSESLHPHPIVANLFDRAELLTMQTEKIIKRGQITIKRGFEKHEFQIPSKLYQKYNDTIVIVKYDDLRDGIYLFEKQTGDAIEFLHPKIKINNAKSLQSESDVQQLFKHKGRVKGINHKAKNELEILTTKALQIDPDAYISLNALTTPKNVLNELEQQSNLKRIAQEKGVAINLLPNNERRERTVSKSLQPIEKNNDNPFKIKTATHHM